MKKKLIGLAAVALFAGLMVTTAWGQDFQKTYALPAGGSISISNVSGEISVTGYNGAVVSVQAYREGRDKEMVQVEDLSTSNQVSLRAQYPRGAGNYDASVRFVIQVPSGSNYKYDKLSTASGDISVTNVGGEIGVSTASGEITISQVVGSVIAKTASGDVKISQVHGNVQANAASGDVTVLGIAGTVSANTASGDVDVELSRIEGSGELKFSSASGDVTVKAPAQLDAQVQMSTASGSIQSDFPLTIEDLEGHGKKAYGTLGSGATKLNISTASGDVRLVRS